MALNKQKNIQIAAMNAKGMTIEAIAKSAGVSTHEAKESLEQRGRSFVELGAMSEEEKTKYIKGLLNKGKSTAEIAGLTGLGKAMVNKFIFGEGEAEIKEEKPEQAEDKPKSKQGGHSKLSEETILKIIQLKKQGLGNAAAAKELGIGATTVFRIWRNYLEEHPEYEPKAQPKKKRPQINKEFDKEIDKMIGEIKKEPTPEKTDEGSNEKKYNKAYTNNSTDQGKCQEELGLLKEDFLAIYANMSEAEQRAWDLGQMYARVLRMRGE